jgi:Flp pilus assembly protein TadG
MIQAIRNWFKTSEGATAIEFSLLVMPFMLITLGIIELSIMFLSASMVEGATDSAARLIRTGKIQQSAGDQESMFREALCDYATALVDCNDMIVEVISIDSYADYTDPVYDSDGTMISQGFDPGGSNGKVIVRVAFRYEMVTPIVGHMLNGADGGTQFISTIVMQSEPYEFMGS